MQNLLSYGDGESAVKITFRNERILQLLETQKSKKMPSTEIENLAEECLTLQENCDKMLSSITNEYRKELHTHSIKRQLRVHLKNT